MNDNPTYYSDLITRYFSGETNPEELRLLSEWLEADEQNREIFTQYRKTWALMEKHKVQTLVNIEEEWTAMQSKMANEPAQETAQIKQLGSTHATRTTFWLRRWKAAASIVVLLGISFLLYFYFANNAAVVVTAQTENIEQVLPDGSVVSLHAGSQITYPSRFGKHSRQVELTGEAYFKVAHDKTKPFIVASGDARVEVLGTRFNVNTISPSGNMEVVLTSGKVSVYYKQKPKENIVLLPGEKAELITETKQLVKTTNNDPNYMAWKTGVLVFDNQSLGDVVATLQHVYHRTVILAEPNLADCKVTASFHDQSLQSVLEVLKATLDIQVTDNGKTIEISGSGCR